MRLFLLLLLVIAALVAVSWDDLKQRASVRQKDGALDAYFHAGAADTASASQGQLRCSREAAAGVKAGAAISRIAMPRKGVWSEQTPRPMITAADLQSVVGP